MTRKDPLDKSFNIYFLLNDNFKTLLIIINIHNVIKWHHLDNNATFRKLKYIYSRCDFDCNQLDL